MRSSLNLALLIGIAACGQEAPVVPQSPEPALGRKGSPSYRVTLHDASLGGTQSVPNSIDQHGNAAGWSNNEGDQTREAVIWRGSRLIELGTLGGPNSSVQWPGQSRSGIVVGIAEMNIADSLGENWSCSAFFPTITRMICRGFAWDNNVMMAMPTFGGTHSYATAVNARGDVVGWAETAVHHESCVAPQRLQFVAALWSPRRGTMRRLRPYDRYPTSAATAINERGQVVGRSCGGPAGCRAVLWEGTKQTLLEDLVDPAFPHVLAAARDINDAGVITGNLTHARTGHIHAFTARTGR